MKGRKEGTSYTKCIYVITEKFSELRQNVISLFMLGSVKVINMKYFNTIGHTFQKDFFNLYYKRR